MEPCNRQRRDVLRIAGAIATAAALSGSSTTRAATAAQPALVAGLLRNPVAGLIALTDQKGWFREAGLNYSSVLFAGAGGPKVLQAMAGGSVGIGSVSVTAALLALASGAVPLRIVSISTDPAPAFALLSSGEIESMPQLAGKRVATTAGTGLHYFLARALRKFDMTLRDVEFLNLPVADAQSAFLARRVDAVVPSLNGRYYIQSLRKDARALFTYDSFAQPPGPAVRFDDYDVFVSPQAAVDVNGPGLRAFLSAYHGKGVPYLLDPATRDAAIADITHYVNAEQKSPTDAAAMHQQLNASRFFETRAVQAAMTADAFRAGLEDQIRFFVDLKQLPATFSTNGLIVTNLV